MEEISFSADGFAIIDAVSENEMQTGRFLEENMKDWIQQSGRELFCKRSKCNTLSELINALEDIYKNLLNKDEVPLFISKAMRSEMVLALAAYMSGGNLFLRG